MDSNTLARIVRVGVWALFVTSAIGGWGASSVLAERERDGRRDVSPNRGIDGTRTGREPRDVPSGELVPSIDGTGHQEGAAERGAAHTPLRRLVPSAYADGASTPAGAERPSARAVSQIVAAQDASRPNPLGASDFFWQWGQFIDHDLDLTDGTDPPEPFDVVVPAGDPWFDPDGSGDARIALNRSLYDPDTGTSTPREQINEITSWIDASHVYGSDPERAAALRTLDGTGRLRTSEGELLPFNVEGFANAGGDGDTLFLAGDVRANEQVGLTVMHTLFVREHNRWAERFAREDPSASGDATYARARRVVIALMQHITVEEFLPVMLGERLPRSRGHDPAIDARISNLFATASFRFGHSALSPTLLRLGEDGGEIAEGALALRDAFFAPQRLVDEGGIDPILRGLAAQPCQTIDVYVIDDVRNFLFGPPGAGGFDLASLNLQRGRDHGLPSYTEVRALLGLERPVDFSGVSSDALVQQRLAEAYTEVDAIDPWIGGLAEDPLPGAMVGELVATVVREQFVALRDGDRFWYTRALEPSLRREVERTRLSDVIRRNTGIGRELPDDVFRIASLQEDDGSSRRGDGRRRGARR